MAFPLQALLHRFHEHAEMTSWKSYAPSGFSQDLESEVNIFGTAGPTAGNLQAADLMAWPLAGRLPVGVGGVEGKVWSLSRDARGCRDVQKALEEADDTQREAIFEELQGHIWDAIRCPHANHVIQKCITVAGPRALQGIIEEIMDGKLIRAARHKYGCRIIQRLIEHCPIEYENELVEQLLSEVLDLFTHTYGTFVVQCLLQHFGGEQRSRLMELIERHLSDLALHANGCAVVNAALQYGDAVDRRRLADMILEDGGLAFMVDTRHGDSILTNLLASLDGVGQERCKTLLAGHQKLAAALQRQ